MLILNVNKWFFFCFTLLCDWSRKLAPLFNQSDAKLKPNTTWMPAFSRASSSLVSFARVLTFFPVSQNYSFKSKDYISKDSYTGTFYS